MLTIKTWSPQVWFHYTERGWFWLFSLCDLILTQFLQSECAVSWGHPGLYTELRQVDVLLPMCCSTESQKKLVYPQNRLVFSRLMKRFCSFPSALPLLFLSLSWLLRFGGLCIRRWRSTLCHTPYPKYIRKPEKKADTQLQSSCVCMAEG